MQAKNISLDKRIQECWYIVARNLKVAIHFLFGRRMGGGGGVERG